MATLQRYDSHLSREFYRAMAWLTALRPGGEAVLEQMGKVNRGKKMYEADDE